MYTTSDGGRTVWVAVWPDGVILTRARIGDPKAPLIVAQAPVAEVDACLAAISNTGFFDVDNEVRAQLDARHTTILVRRNTQRGRQVWTEHLSHALNDKSMHPFVHRWLKVRAAIMAVCPTTCQSLEEAMGSGTQFRGYDPTKGLDVSWMN